MLGREKQTIVRRKYSFRPNVINNLWIKSTYLNISRIFLIFNFSVPRRENFAINNLIDCELRTVTGNNSTCTLESSFEEGKYLILNSLACIIWR